MAPLLFPHLHNLAESRPNTIMPPRRSKKPVAPKVESSSNSESDHEAPAQSLTSKLTSKLKSIVGLETEEPKPASTTSKRKRASLATNHDDEAEVTAKATPSKKPRAKKSTGGHVSVEPPPKRPRKSVAVVAKEDSSESDEEQVVVTTPAKVPKSSARKPRTKQSTYKKTDQGSKKSRKSVAAAVEDEDPTSESEDELATAPVSPVKPRAKGKAKATTPRRSPRKSAPVSDKKSTTTSARKTRKAKDEYDSSIRELSHDSDSATPSESDGHDLENYDPKREADKEKLDDSEEEEEAALETMEVDSEALDDESDFGPHKIAERASASPVKKRGGNSEKAKGRKSVAQSGRKSTGKRAKKEATSEEEYESDQSGAITVGKIAKAPQTGHVPPGQISQNTFDFLLNLQDPEKNDREWFKLHEPVFRLAEKEWIAFVDAWVTELVEVDDEVPPLPPKDVIHRIYRDVRFSNDKTPYKPNFSASTSRSGRKGIFAGYHISIKPGGESMVAAGTWCPGKDELHSIRNVIKRNHARRLRHIIAEPSFVKFFGSPKPVAAKGKNKERTRQSIFGREDELKVAPAGVKKDHPFTDAQVLHKDFLEKTLKPVLVEMRPFVHCLNDYMTLPLDEMSEASSSSSSSSSDNE